jgi:hypothetical protein
VRRLLRDVFVAIVGGLAASLALSLGQADPNVALAAGIGVCVAALLILETPGIAGLFGKPLKVKITDRHAHPLNYAAEAVAIELSIKNRTWRSIELPGGYNLTVYAAENPQTRAALSAQQKAGLVQKLAYERDTSHHQPSLRDRAVVPAYGSVTAWVVTDVDHLPHGAHPEITIGFADGRGNQYKVVAKRQGRRPGQLHWWVRLWPGRGRPAHQMRP